LKETGQPILDFTGVSKRFADGTLALEGFDLRVTKGEFVSVVGPSGCGKSTLLRIVSGLTDASAGTVAVNTDEMGYVFQDPTLLPWRRVQDNVELFGELRRMPKAERSRRAADAIALVGLSDFVRHHPRALSGGMRMRVSLARTLTLRPELFLFDEPFAALDEISRERLNDELLQLYATQGFSALFVTHSVTEAVFLSTRVVVMTGRPGKLRGDFAVPFDYPRSPQLRFDQRFAKVAGEVSACLRGLDQPRGAAGETGAKRDGSQNLSPPADVDPTRSVRR
jgi:NitT/TauT family transport system ATP-binding protein